MEGFKPIKDLDKINGGQTSVTAVCYGVEPIAKVLTSIQSVVKNA